MILLRKLEAVRRRRPLQPTRRKVVAAEVVDDHVQDLGGQRRDVWPGERELAIWGGVGGVDALSGFSGVDAFRGFSGFSGFGSFDPFGAPVLCMSRGVASLEGPMMTGETHAYVRAHAHDARCTRPHNHNLSCTETRSVKFNLSIEKNYERQTGLVVYAAGDRMEKTPSPLVCASSGLWANRQHAQA